MTLPGRKSLFTAIGLVTPCLALAQEASNPYRNSDIPLQRLAAEDTHLVAMRVIPLVFVVVITTITLFFVSQRERRRQELLTRFVERGQEIPAALLPQARDSRDRALRRGVGLTCLAIGVGLAIYLSTGNLEAAAWSLVPLSLGVGSFINAGLMGPGRDAG